MRLKKTIHTGLNWLGSRRDARGGVLLYHRVDEPTLDPFNLCVSPANFEKQLALIAEGGRALALHEFMERKNRDTLERGSICLTFDDGYLDVFEKALPLLEKYEVPATVFVTTGNLGEAFWWDRLAVLIYGTKTLPNELFVESSQSTPFRIEGLSPKSIYELLYPILRSASPRRRESIFDTLASQLIGDPLMQAQRAATAGEIRKAASHPLLTIGAHTVSHSRLSSLDYQSQVAEIEESVDTLSEITGRPIDSLSYPFGLKGRDYDSTTLKAAADAGIKYGFAADLNAVTHQTDNLAIPRLWVHDRGESAVRVPIRLWTGTQIQPPVGLCA